ncbi:MAG TPA: F420-0--gamma-glutamyl ligase [Firmicutes bacterium]|jgi:hypothetical protein|nr:F420-0--gamma-glutamyl ligase [Bacillota bacterium]
MKKYDPIVHVGNEAYLRIMIKTHTIMKGEDIGELLVRYVQPELEPGDIIFVSEKAAAAAQGRAVPLDEIKPSWLARFLVRFVYKAPYGIGLGMPETMEMAIREVGVLRILLAAFIGGLGKLFGIRGLFYHVAGHKARSIDGPADYVIPPYNRHVVLGVADADGLCRQAAAKVGAPVAIVDANDIGMNIIGLSSPDLKRFPWHDILKDNPAGQSKESTPFGIIRPLGAVEKGRSLS